MGEWNCTLQIPIISINCVVLTYPFHPGISNASIPYKEAH